MNEFHAKARDEDLESAEFESVHRPVFSNSQSISRVEVVWCCSACGFHFLDQKLPSTCPRCTGMWNTLES